MWLPCKSEVADSEIAVSIDQNVAGLQIPADTGNVGRCRGMGKCRGWLDEGGWLTDVAGLQIPVANGYSVWLTDVGREFDRRVIDLVMTASTEW